MSWEVIFVFLLLGFAVTSFCLEWLSTDETAIVVFAAILIAGSLPVSETLPGIEGLIQVFASPAPLAIACMFILSAALERCGVIESFASRLEGLTRLNFRMLLIIQILVVAVISAFINNTPVVVIFMPVVLSLSRRMNIPASKLLIPLSYASIFGGVCTLVGTSTNILASGVAEDAGLEPLSMFELAWVGLPLLLVGSLYLVFIAPSLLPARESLTSILSDEERREYFTEAYIKPESRIIGKSATQSGLLKSRGIRILEIIRDEVALQGDLKHTPLKAGDRLVLACRPSGFAHAHSMKGLDLGPESEEGLETISAHEGAIVEGVIGPRSSIAGKTIRELNFRQRFRMIILAIHRRGINMRDRIDSTPLRFGDTILMMGTDKAREEIRRGGDIILLDRPATPANTQREKAPLVLGAMIVMIFLVSMNWMRIEAAAIIAVAFIFATRSLKPEEGYQSIDWGILILIYGMLGLGMAMETTGASQLVADTLITLTDVGIPPDLQPYVVLACLYLVTTTFTEILSNNATVVLMAPIAISLGQTMGVDPRSFLIATCIASSASFATPIGYQTNTYVYGAGGYRFTDFLKVGIPLNLTYFVFSVFLIPQIWKF